MLRASMATSLAIAATVAVGCSQGDADRLETYSVHGTAKYNGQPMAGASIVLIPESPSPKQKMPPFGRIDSDGSFEITSYANGDGAPAGKYKVTFTWSNGDPDSPTDLLGGKFDNPHRPVSTVTIEAGDNELPPFDLKGPAIQLPVSPAS